MVNRKYTQNDKFFDKTNLRNSYWAGFIAADGYIVLDHGRKALGITLHKKDVETLSSLSEEMCYTGPVYEGVNNWSVPWVRIIISSGRNKVLLHSSKTIYRICISTKRANKVLGVLAQLDTPALERKWKNYLEMAPENEIQRLQKKSNTKKKRK